MLGPVFLRRGSFFLISVGISLLSHGAFAEDLVASCTPCFNQKRGMVISHFESLEDHFIRYRWVEARLRRVYYERLWQARTLQQHPLSKANRDAGREEEKRLREVVKELEERSEEASNRFWLLIEEIQQSHGLMKDCCPVGGYASCIQDAFGPVYDLMSRMRVHFDHIFEHEREYRTNVKRTAGGKGGMYPEDTVEDSEGHTNYYWRFESEREPRRYEENTKMMDMFHEAEKILTWNFAGENCCYQCQ